MTRQCGHCGTPPPDDQAQFCNRCGSAIVDVAEPEFPTCGTCGTRVADPHAQFCDKCGGPVQKEAVIPACPTCGNKAIDANSRFCTRCGTTFTRPTVCPGCGFPIPEDNEAVFCNRCGGPLPGKAAARPAQQPIPTAPETTPSVVITKRRITLPVPGPAAEWDPWTDGSPEYDAAPQEPPAAYTPPDTGERAGAPQIRIPPQKRYAHLPLIADELKGPKNQYTEPDDSFVPPRKEPSQKKKGVMGFLKK
jgi:rRNA maturation endonuclease Nob1